MSEGCGPVSVPEDRPDSPVIGCLARILAWAAVLFSLRLAFAGGWLLRGADAGFRFVFGRPAASVAGSAVAVAVVLGQVAILLQGILGDRVPVLRAYVGAVGKLLAFLPRAAWWAIEAVFMVVEGRAPVVPGGKPRKREKEVR